MRLIRPYRFVIVIMLVVMMLSSCGNMSGERGDKQYKSVEGFALGTFVQVVSNTDKSQGEILSMVESVDKELKSSMSIFDDSSLLSRINRGETDSLDRHVVRNIELAARFTHLSDGAYDVTVKPLTEAWGFAGEQRGESTPNVDSILQFVGFDKIAVHDGVLVRSDERVQLDFNSIAKGYTVDIMADSLESMGAEDYLINIGGEIRCKGKNAKGERWSIGVETPYDGNVAMDSYEKVIYLTDCALATSGNYRRFYTTADGRKVVHTIDPRTGYSVVSELLSATVVAKTCAEADAAATMFMALGSEGGALELAKRCEVEYGWHYVFIYSDGEGYRIECSEIFK